MLKAEVSMGQQCSLEAQKSEPNRDNTFLKHSCFRTFGSATLWQAEPKIFMVKPMLQVLEVFRDLETKGKLIWERSEENSGCIE